MKDTFYLIVTHEHREPWYQLVVKDTNFCISSGTNLERIREVLKSYIKTYRTREGLLKALSNLDGCGKVSTATFAQREDYFKNHGKDYDHLIRPVIEEAWVEVLEEVRANKPINKVKARMERAGQKGLVTRPSVLSPAPKIETAERKVLTRRPKVFKLK